MKLEAVLKLKRYSRDGFPCGKSVMKSLYLIPEEILSLITESVPRMALYCININVK